MYQYIRRKGEVNHTNQKFFRNRIYLSQPQELQNRAQFLCLQEGSPLHLLPAHFRDVVLMAADVAVSANPCLNGVVDLVEARPLCSPRRV